MVGSCVLQICYSTHSYHAGKSLFIEAANHPFCRTEREKLYNCWSEQLRSGWLGELKLAMREYEGVRDEQRRIHADVDLNVLKGARLVGMTTAGVANKQDLVAAMAPKVRLFLLLPSLLASQYALRVQAFIIYKLVLQGLHAQLVTDTSSDQKRNRSESSLYTNDESSLSKSL